MQQSAACQIIAVNDGSVDGSLELLRPFLPAITVLSGPNQGPAAARNRGLAEAAGDWTIFLDADDELLPGTIEKRLETASRTGADVVIADWEEEREEADEKIVTTIGHFDWAAFDADPELATGIIAWAQIGSTLYRTSLIQEIGGFRTNIHVAEDARLNWDCVRAGAIFAHSDHLGVRYNFVPGSQSRASKSRFFSNAFVNLNEIMCQWQSEGKLTAERRFALAEAFHCCERNLFGASHPLYFEAYAARKSLGLPAPLHSRVTMPLSRLLGLHLASALLPAIRNL